MTPIDTFERRLPTALSDLAAPSTPDYLTDILGRTAATSQRPAWASLERWLPVELVNARATTARIPWRQLGVLAVLAVLLAATLAVYIGAQPRLPEPFGLAANGLVVYSKGGDIFVRDSVAGTSRPLIATPKEEIADSLSPLGTHVLIVRPEGALLDFFAATIDGRNEVHLGGPYLDVDGMSGHPMSPRSWSRTRSAASRRSRSSRPTAVVLGRSASGCRSTAPRGDHPTAGRSRSEVRSMGTGPGSLPMPTGPGSRRST